MATVNYLYRSTKDIAPLNVRLLFRHEGKDHVIGAKTRQVVTKSYWQNDHDRKRIKDIDIHNTQTEVKDHLDNLEGHILSAFFSSDISEINKKWLSQTVNDFYNPEKSKKNAPLGLVDFFEYYIDIKRNDLSDSRIRRLNVVKNKLIRFEENTGRNIMMKDINDEFKKDFQNYSNSLDYADLTLKTDFSVIKTVCRYANEIGVKVSKQFKNLKVKTKRSKAIYLSFEELQKIKDLDLSDNPRLDNVRDWLLISCFTGQRISDFMRFTKEMIREKEGKKLLEFVQVKTKKRMVIPFIKEAFDVIEKNEGEFPRPISDQRYNEYIKEVCQLAGLNDPTEGKVLELINPEKKDPTYNDYRKVKGTYPKWMLVSSHIGRRSFATNYYGKVPTSYLINITGHSTETMFLNYIQRKESETALDAFKYFES